MWLLFILSSTALASTCPKYTCSSSSTTESECQAYSNSTGIQTYTLTPCEYGLTCPYTTGKNENCQNSALVNSRFPGDYCSQNFECMSGTCKSNICQGIALGGNCTSSSLVESGLYCNEDGKAVALLEAGNNCDHFYECDYGLTCDIGVCVKMFSLANGELTDEIWPQGMAPSCQTAFAVSFNESFWKCTNAPVSVNTSLTPCPASGKCTAHDGVNTKACACGLDGNSYCPLFEGDAPVLDLVYNWKNLITNYIKANPCNTMNRWGYACFAAPLGTSFNTQAAYYNFTIYSSQYLNNDWVRSLTAPPCANSTILINYTNSEQQLNNALNEITQCPVYSCTNFTSDWGANQCISFNQDIYAYSLSTILEVNPCKNNTTYCPPNSSTNSTCTANPTPSLRNPGEFCTTGTQCESLKCENARCTGVANGGSCAKNECAVGYWCNSTSLCEPFVTTGECSADTQCNTYSVCVNHTCVEMFSLDLGMTTVIETKGNYGYAPSCKSGFGVLSGDVAKCTTAPVSPQNKVGSLCQSGSLCMDSTNTYSKKCVCGYDGKGRCPTFEGDVWLVNAINNFNNITKSKVECYYATGLSSLCVMFNETVLTNYYHFYTNLTQYENSASLANNDYCIKTVYNQEYWTAYDYINPKKKHDSSGFALGFAALALISFSF
ncbi:hypothetical protein SteCoe_14217 [Stentor coeruleus]|uniref:Uncharacterized protein n=1 Tax=Stentor coeruleus TaxID=5963 RepID=A0A1R2C6H8_9CILI|nr:hypothetical protein SteCoe_14217 [Stentor coeruleus]